MYKNKLKKIVSGLLCPIMSLGGISAKLNESNLDTSISNSTSLNSRIIAPKNKSNAWKYALAILGIPVIGLGAYYTRLDWAYTTGELLGSGKSGSAYKSKCWLPGGGLHVKKEIPKKIFIGMDTQALERDGRMAKAEVLNEIHVYNLLKNKSLDHVAKIEDYHRWLGGDGYTFLYELVDGNKWEDSDWKKEHESEKKRLFCSLVRQYLAGIRELQKCGILHFDAHRKNIVITKDDEKNPLLKLIDFGRVLFIEEKDKSHNDQIPFKTDNLLITGIVNVNSVISYLYDRVYNNALEPESANLDCTKCTPLNEYINANQNQLKLKAPVTITNILNSFKSWDDFANLKIPQISRDEVYIDPKTHEVRSCLDLEDYYHYISILETWIREFEK